ncbi:MAG TPA: hypothetical protein VE993_13875 [Stellaceae bacterium]|nr:hypothetical protein [Stellaceae bacterium]
MKRASALIGVNRHRTGFLEARPLPGSGRRGEVLAAFLQSDVQGDLAAARALLAETAAAERGEEPQPGGAGNAFWIGIAADGAVIANALLPGAPPERYRLGELRAALADWIAAIERAHTGRDRTQARQAPRHRR